MGKVNYYLAKINRTLIWVTLALFAFFTLCGYGITNPILVSRLTGGLLNRTLSLYYHTLLAFPVLLLMLIHVLIGLKFALMRWGVKDGKLLNSFIVALGIFTIAIIILFEKLFPQ
ncbi:MAG: hypothetical protein QXJ02_03280 [Candidatus Bathyarchaeia archaeon]